MRRLIVGHGEIGKGLCEIWGGAEWVDLTGHSLGYRSDRHFDVLHVAIPWTEKFRAVVQEYAIKHTAGLVIIHSTVPIGTTQSLGLRYAVHAPVRAKHPDIAKGLRTYRLYVGCDHDEANYRAYTALDAQSLSHKPAFVVGTGTTEAAKLLSLTQYAFEIEYHRLAKAVCDETGADPLVCLKHYPETYNEGMRRQGLDHLQKTILEPPAGKIGGHCVLPAVSILKGCLTKDRGLLRHILSINDGIEHRVPRPVEVNWSEGETAALLKKAADMAADNISLACEPMRSEWDRPAGSFVHPTCNIYGSPYLAEGVRVGAFTEIGPHVEVGKDTRIGAMCFICEGVRIGTDAFIGPRVTFCNDMYPPSGKENWRDTRVEAGAAIGAACTILPGVTIGQGALIGAGSVVTKDVPRGEVWAGNPARFMRQKEG